MTPTPLQTAVREGQEEFRKECKRLGIGGLMRISLNPFFASFANKIYNLRNEEVARAREAGRDEREKELTDALGI